MLVVFSGLLAGLVHVLTGPDHLAAVAPLAVKAHRGALLSGLRWGLGHSAGVGFVGLLALAFRGTLPLEWLRNWGEQLVGVLLVGLGFWALRKASQVQIHTHAHEHGGEAHDHVHFHDHGHRHPVPPTSPSNSEHRHAHAAFGIGTLHGLAGSSHFLGVLPALGFVRWTDSLSYLGAFGFGTIIAMSGFAAVLGQLAQWFATDHLKLYRSLMYTCSVFALGTGGWWLLIGPV